jgi:hypothetical protein
MEECRTCKYADSNFCCAATRKTREAINCHGVYKESGAKKKNVSPQKPSIVNGHKKCYGGKRSERRPRGECRIITKDQYNAECEAIKAIRKEGARKKQLI